MLIVLAALLYLYASAGVKMLSTWRQSRRDDAAVGVLGSEHRRLEAERRHLEATETVELEARRLGMIGKNERPYLLPGAPHAH